MADSDSERSAFLSDSDLPSPTEATADLSLRFFKTEKTRIKYAKYITIKEIRTQAKKRKANDDGEDESIAVVYFECHSCSKIYTYFADHFNKQCFKTSEGKHIMKQNKFLNFLFYFLDTWNL